MKRYTAMEALQNCVRVGLLVGLVIPSTVMAQAVSTPQQPPAGRAAGSKPLPCGLAPSQAQKDAVGTAEALFDASWLKSNAGRDSAFQTKAEVVSPFAIKDPKAEPPRPAISGFVHAAQVECRVIEATGSAGGSAGAEWLIEFFGLNVRFYEDGKWSAPVKRGLLMAIVVTSGDGGMKAAPKPEAPTVVLPDATLRQPLSSEVPPLTLTKAGAKPKKG